MEKEKPALIKADREYGWIYLCPDCYRFMCASGICKCGTHVNLQQAKEWTEKPTKWD